MNAKHIWSIICRESIVNQDDNVMSIIGILEELNTTLTPKDPKIPRPEKITIPFNFEVVSYWVRNSASEGILYIKTAIADPDGKEISSVLSDSPFPNNVQRLRTRLKVQGLTLTKSGEYYVRVGFKTNKGDEYKLVSELPLKVTITIGTSKTSS